MLRQQERTKAGDTGRDSDERQETDKGEILVLLRENVKTELVDLLRKNPDTSGSSLVDQTNRILVRNLSNSESFQPMNGEDRITR